MENIHIEKESENEKLDKRTILDISSERAFQPMIGDKAPLFVADTTMGKRKLTDYMDRWVVLFSYPGDFTPVCTTELIALAKVYPEFEKRNTALIGLSVDSVPSHLSWIHNIHRNTGIQIPFPIISDSTMDISKKYSMISPNVATTKTIRKVYIIDPDQRIRAILEYPLETGRNIGEILRLLDALQFSDNKNLYTPANWIPNQSAILPPPKTYNDILDNINNSNTFNCIDWYLCFTQETFQAQPMMFDDINNVMMKNEQANINNIQFSNYGNFMRDL